MRSTALAAGLALLALTACGKKAAETPAMDNPFFAEFATPFGVPPFDLIKPEHYRPAFERGMAEQRTEVAAITAYQAAITFLTFHNNSVLLKFYQRENAIFMSFYRFTGYRKVRGLA